MSEGSSEIVESLKQWIFDSDVIEEKPDFALKRLSGDAGFRQYFQIIVAGEVNENFLAVYAPPDQLDSQPFVDVGFYLREEGIHAPQVFNFDPKQGFLLIENYGDELYLSALNADTVESLYGEALLTLLRMQQSPPQPTLLPAYSEAMLREEMDCFSRWFVEELLGYSLNEPEKKIIDKVFSTVIESAEQQPQVFVHRDFHSRNLIHRPIGPPGVIDFQDAVWGPITYDLVSLLKDCYVRWPESLVERWALAYGSMISSAGLMKPVSAEQFLRWFDLMGLQRHLKVLGVFSRLFLRDGKSTYLADLPLVMRYALTVIKKYPEFDEFSEWFQSTLLPVCEKQSWYQDYTNAGYCPISAEAEK